MPSLLHRALACALSASMALTPCATVFAQKKGDAKAAPKSDAKAAPKSDAKGDAKGDAKPRKPPTKAEKTKAKAAFKLGDEKFQAGDFAAAAEAFKEANDTIPSPQAAFRVAVSYDKAGKGPEALNAYKNFIDLGPPEKMSEQKTSAEARIRELSVGTVKLASTPDGAAVTVDGQPAAGPTPLTLTLRPGPHTLELTLPKFEPAPRELVVAAGGTSEVTIPLKELPPPPPPPVVEPPPPPPPVAAPPPPPKEEPKPSSKVPAYVTLGLAGAGAVVGTIFGVKALSSQKDFKSTPTTENADNAERNALIADMAFGVALTLGITGTVLLLSGNKKNEPPKAGQLKLLPVLTPQAQGAAAILRF